MKNYKNFNENLGYKTIFGKEVTHNEALQKRIRDNITQIIIEEKQISEKDFTRSEEVMNNVKNFCNENKSIYVEADDYYKNNKRLELLAEITYDKYFKNNI